MKRFDLLCCVVNHEHGSKVLKVAKQHGVKGGTIFVGRGTIKNKLLAFLELTDIRKEIVLMGVDSGSSNDAMQSISKEMGFHKPNHGIIFSISLENFIGHRHLIYNSQAEEEDNKGMYNVIFTVVAKGLAEDVVDAATKAGARGGTILNARGSSIHETSVVFAMPIEPEKEMVMIVSEAPATESITGAIRKKLNIDEPGNGVVFTVGVKDAYGLY